MKKKILCVLMVLSMILSVVPSCAFADGETGTVLPDASITVPSDATLFVGSKAKIGGKDAHFVSFDEVVASDKLVNEAEGTTSYYYDLTNNGVYNFRVSGSDYVTYAGKFTKSANYQLEITKSQLQPEGKTKTTVDRNTSSNNGYNEANIYLNINSQNYLKLSEGEVYTVAAIRNWQAVDSITNNYYIEPDYHYSVLNESFEEDQSVISISNDGVITAKAQGTAIVLVTYDAINVASAVGGPFFGAIWPENTGVFVVSVGADDSGIDANMLINKGRNTNDTTQKQSLNNIDSELDVIYFFEDCGSYTFKPATADCQVSVANPTVSTIMSYSGFSDISKNNDDSFTVPLKEGRNIVKISKSDKTEYQIITAKHVDITVNNGIPVVPGEPVIIQFSQLYNPVNKLAGVYNFSAAVIYNNVDYYTEKKSNLIIGTSSAQYNYGSSLSAHTLSGALTRKAGFPPSYSSDTKNPLVVPADWQESVFSLKDGCFIMEGFGDACGNHHYISPETGRKANLAAQSVIAYIGSLPDINLSITSLSGISVKTQPTRLTYNIGDCFDPQGMIVNATYLNGENADVTKYSYDKSVFDEAGNKDINITYTQGVVSVSTSVAITVNDVSLDHIEITTAPSKVNYQVNENFESDGMVVTAFYSDQSSAEVSTYSVNKEKLISSDTEVTVSYNGKTASQPVSVTGRVLSKIAVTTKPSKMSYYVGEYLDPTGLLITATYNDTTTDDITTKITLSNNQFTAKGTKSVKVSYTENGTTKTVNITGITVSDAPSQENVPDTITVYFTLLGDDAHDSDTDGNIHTLKQGNLTSWVSRTAVTVDVGSTVGTVVAKVLGMKGIPYSNTSGDYISQIRNLSEFTNGTQSGWMYTLNGSHSQLGVGTQTVKDGDEIVLHYTDSYSAEQGSEQWSEPYYEPSSKKENTKNNIETQAVEAKDGKAEVKIDEKNLNNAVDTLIKSNDANKNQEQRIEIKAEVKGDAKEVNVSLPEAALKTITEKTEATVDVQTPNGNMAMPNDALTDIVKQAGGKDLNVIFETKAPEDVKNDVSEKLIDALKYVPAKEDGTKFDEKLLENATILDVKISAGDKNITSFNGASIKVSIPVDSKKYEDGKYYRTFILSGNKDLEAKSAKIEGGNAEVDSTHLSTFIITEEEVSPFIDIDIKKDWFAESATKAFEKKIINGVGENTFDAKGIFTRAMLVQVLWNLDGNPDVDYKINFTDAEEGCWYESALRWAQFAGIVSGYPDGRFDPNGAVTREQMALILNNYAQYKKMDVSQKNDLSSFNDTDKISEWALAALEWANAAEIINGFDNNLNPVGLSSRAEAAIMLVRFIEKVIK